jgi:endonuclease YncB( thermonuclease family)
MRWRRRGRRTALLALLVAVLILGARAWLHEREPPDRQGGAVATGSASPTVAPAERRGPYPVTRVVDGDTLHVEIAGALVPTEKVRLLRIDTPERNHPGYERATAALKALVEDRDVFLVFEDPDSPQRDEYGRLLAYVLLDDANVNLELVRRGWSRFFTKYGEGRFGDAFAIAEAEARDSDRGLWRDGIWNDGARAAESARRRR